MASAWVTQLDDGRDWLTDGHIGLSCDIAFKMLGVLKELSDCNCSASISNGFLELEDGTCYDLRQIIREASR